MRAAYGLPPSSSIMSDSRGEAIKGATPKYNQTQVRTGVDVRYSGGGGGGGSAVEWICTFVGLQVVLLVNKAGYAACCIKFCLHCSLLHEGLCPLPGVSICVCFIAAAKQSIGVDLVTFRSGSMLGTHHVQLLSMQQLCQFSFPNSAQLTAALLMYLPELCRPWLMPLAVCPAALQPVSASSGSWLCGCQTSNPRPCWTLGRGQAQPSGLHRRWVGWIAEVFGLMPVPALPPRPSGYTVISRQILSCLPTRATPGVHESVMRNVS